MSKEIEKKERHQAIYSGSFHNPEVVHSSFHFQGEFTKINILLQLLKHNNKRLQTTQAQLQEVSYAQAELQETSYAQAQLQETSYSNRITKKMFEVELLIYN